MESRPRRKSVRFVDNAPRTPSPASSTASDSWASSPGPSTPPQPIPTPFHTSPRVVRHPEYPLWQSVSASPPSPHSYPAFQSAPAEEQMVDPLLEVLPPPALPPLMWDIATHPDNIRLGSAHSPGSQHLAKADLPRPAARTSVKNSRLPLRRMILVLPGIPLEVEVTPSAEAYWSSQPLPFVTVGDLLYGLYRALRTSVGHDEYDGLDAAQREALRAAFEARLRRDPQHHAQNIAHGIRRIDYLGDRRRFLGIRPASRHEVPRGRRPEEVFVVERGRAS